VSQRGRRCILATIGLCWASTLLGTSHRAFAQPIGREATEHSTSDATAHVGSDSNPDATLPPLPEIPRLDTLQPSAEEVQELDDKLRALISGESDTTDSAVGDLLEVRSRMVAAIHMRLMQMADHADKERMKRIVAEARLQPRSENLKQASQPSTRQPGTDLLAALLRDAKPKDSSWRDCVYVVALLRMLSAISNVEAAREMIFVYARFGEFIRPEVQQRLLDMKDRSVSALIEARRHAAEKISRWAALRLDQMGKAIPGESARTNDYEALADILRAYGRIRDPDAARIIVSFANSERGQLRVAARQAIAMLGTVGLWQLRDAYEDVVGRRPRRDWTWERTARELFGEFDRLRLARVYGTFVEGLEKLRKGDLEAMGRAFDWVLTKDPLFEKRAQMAEGYLKLAQDSFERNPETSRQAAIRAERLATDDKLRNQARSLVVTVQAIASAKRGVVDVDKLGRALELDPSNVRARNLIALAQAPGAAYAHTTMLRWVSSAVISAIGLLAVVLVLLRRGRQAANAATVANGSHISTLDPRDH
jgi:hypothetical protein